LSFGRSRFFVGFDLEGYADNGVVRAQSFAIFLLVQLDLGEDFSNFILSRVFLEIFHVCNKN